MIVVMFELAPHGVMPFSFSQVAETKLPAVIIIQIARPLL